MKEQSWLEEGWLFHNHAWHLLHEIIKQFPRDAESFLDVGTGTGLAAAVIKAVFPEIIGTVSDVETECVPFWMKRYLPGFIIEQNIIPRPDNDFDIVYSSHVLEHLEDPFKLIAEMYRVAKRRVIIAVPDGDVHFYDHKVIFNRTVLKNYIEGALKDKKYSFVSFPVYHHHINNLVAVIDKHE